MDLYIGVIIANIITLLGVIGVPIYKNHKKEKENHKLKIRLGIFKSLEFLEIRCKEVLKEYSGSGDYLDYDGVPIFALIPLKHLSEIKFYTKEYFSKIYDEFLKIENELLEIRGCKELQKIEEQHGIDSAEHINRYKEYSARDGKKLEDIMEKIRKLKNRV